MSENKRSKAGIISRTAASFGLKKKKTGFEVVERGNTTGLYAMIDNMKKLIPNLNPIQSACNNEINNLTTAENMQELTKALEDFKKSLGAVIEVTVSPDNETTNEIMKSAFLIAKDKVRAYAKNNNVLKNTDLASLTKMQRNMTLRENLTANAKAKAKAKAKANANAKAKANEKAKANANAKAKAKANANAKAKANANAKKKSLTGFNTSGIPKEKESEQLALGWGVMENDNINNALNSTMTPEQIKEFHNMHKNTVAEGRNLRKNKPVPNKTTAGGGAKVRRKKATTGMKKKKVTTGMKKKKVTTGMKKKKVTTGMKKKKATTTAMKKKKATGTKKKATKKKQEESNNNSYEKEESNMNKEESNKKKATKK